MALNYTPVAFIPVGKDWSIVDAEDYEWLSRLKWHNINGYACCYEKNAEGVSRRCQMHRMIMQPPSHLVIDHRNHDPLNNTRQNLRICTRSENQKNQSKMVSMNGKSTSSKYKGVYRHKNGKYKATIRCNGKQYHLGYHKNEIDAAKAYDAKARELHGEFAVLNFPDTIKCHL